MNKIHIADGMEELLPKEFVNFMDDDKEYRLTKTESTRENWFVMPGDKTRGTLTVVEVLGKPGIKVFRTFTDYIRTSPIVEVVDTTDNTITFRTEGGVYKLERLEDN